MGKQAARPAGPIPHPAADLTGTLSQPKQESASQERILRLYLQGDPDAFWNLWELNRSYLYGVCLRQMGGVREDAEDALSLAMLKAWERLPDHAPKIINVKAWLTRMTCNLCIDMHRERRRVKNVGRIEDMTLDDHMSAACSVESPEQAILFREMNLHVQRAFNDLPPRLRAPMILHSFQAMPYRDIAGQLMLTNENVRKRIQHARVFLHERLRSYHSGVTASDSSALRSRKPRELRRAPGRLASLSAATTS
ncbi:MAG TPA: sigma-70 family RNA polymerase sigma factor [Blastocatellia bacterium]|nr:sigma-70 family RNA polymerase sigma factor [Blastocatellia bacterium]